MLYRAVDYHTGEFKDLRDFRKLELHGLIEGRQDEFKDCRKLVTQFSSVILVSSMT